MIVIQRQIWFLSSVRLQIPVGLDEPIIGCRSQTGFTGAVNILKQHKCCQLFLKCYCCPWTKRWKTRGTLCIDFFQYRKLSSVCFVKQTVLHFSRQPSPASRHSCSWTEQRWLPGNSPTSNSWAEARGGSSEFPPKSPSTNKSLCLKLRSLKTPSESATSCHLPRHRASLAARLARWVGGPDTGTPVWPHAEVAHF